MQAEIARGVTSGHQARLRSGSNPPVCDVCSEPVRKAGPIHVHT